MRACDMVNLEIPTLAMCSHLRRMSRTIAHLTVDLTRQLCNVRHTCKWMCSDSAHITVDLHRPVCAMSKLPSQTWPAQMHTKSMLRNLGLQTPTIAMYNAPAQRRASARTAYNSEKLHTPTLVSLNTNVLRACVDVKQEGVGLW